jgi:hypothetical protein
VEKERKSKSERLQLLRFISDNLFFLPKFLRAADILKNSCGNHVHYPEVVPTPVHGWRLGRRKAIFVTYQEGIAFAAVATASSENQLVTPQLPRLKAKFSRSRHEWVSKVVNDTHHRFQEFTGRSLAVGR